MRNDLIIVSSLVALSLVLISSAAASTDDKIDLTTWDQSLLHDGWRATEFLDAEVYGKGGEQIGEVENFYVDIDGRLTQVIVESGGLLDVGDVHLAVPWDEVRKWPGEDGILVPIDDDNVPDFSLFRPDPRPGVAVWKVTDLIHDLVYLADGDQYGIVEDLIVAPEGRVAAIIVSPDISEAGGKRTAYPWNGDGFAAEVGRYDLPYDRREIELLGPFDYHTVGQTVGQTVGP